MTGRRPDILRWSLFFFILVSVGRIHSHLPLIGAFRPGVVVFLVTVGWAIAVPRSVSWENLKETWPPKVLLALAVVACLTVPFGISAGRAGRFFLDSFGKTLLMSIIMIAAIRSVRDLSLFIWGFVLSAGIWSYTVLFRFDLSQSSGGVMRLDNLITFDSNDLGLVLVTALPLTLLTFEISRRPGKILSIAILVGIGMALAYTGSRGAFVGLLAVGVGLVLGLKQASIGRPIAALLLVTAGLFTVAPAGYWDRMSTLTSPTDDYNWTSREGRKEVALRGLGYMLTHPVFGLGIDNFARAECTIAEKATENVPGTGYRCTAPHNSYVQVASEMGISGLVLWLWILVGGTIGIGRWRRSIPPGWRHGDPEERFLFLTSMYLPVSFIGFAVTATFLSFAYLEPFYLLTAYMAGLFALTERRLRMLTRPGSRDAHGQPGGGRFSIRPPVPGY